MLDDIIAYESGELDASGTLALFSRLIATGQAYALQGHYGRMAVRLIDAGWLAVDGTILRSTDELQDA